MGLTRTVVLTRPRRWVNRLLSYDIFVDGVMFAEIRTGQTLSFQVPADAKQLSAKLSRYSSPAFLLPADNGVGLELQVENAASFHKFFNLYSCWVLAWVLAIYFSYSLSGTLGMLIVEGVILVLSSLVLVILSWRHPRFMLKPQLRIGLRPK